MRFARFRVEGLEAQLAATTLNLVRLLMYKAAPSDVRHEWACVAKRITPHIPFGRRTPKWLQHIYVRHFIRSRVARHCSIALDQCRDLDSNWALADIGMDLIKSVKTFYKYVYTRSINEHFGLVMPNDVTKALEAIQATLHHSL